ncbi:MAG TPA: hypothetical protein VI584_05270 [Nitrospiria bacterium]|nr:hypothetical protein [Nitrospiria bacterium]
MKRLFLILLMLSLSAFAWSDEGVIKIKTVKLIQSRLVITFEHQREDPTDNVHLFIDGVFSSKGVKRDTILIDDLEPGTHIIEVLSATRDYKIKGACQKVEFNLIDTKSLETIIGGCGQ